MDAKDNTIAFIRTKHNDEILGVVQECESPSGNRFPIFRAEAKGRDMPTIFMLAEGEDDVFSFRTIDVTLADYFSAPFRRQLAGFYAYICKRQNWQLDDHATLNVVYWLEQNGITGVNDDNVVTALEIIQSVREAFYSYIDFVETTPEERAKLQRH